MKDTHKALIRSATLALIAVAAVAVGGRLEIPLVPVPVTLQSLAVVVVGGLLGPGRGALAMILYLALGAAGAPVFSGGAGGIDHLTGPTAGYLWSFPFAASLCGLAGRAPGIKDFLVRVLVYGAAHLVILGLGTLWLAGSLGIQDALVSGLVPFVPGAWLKSVAGAAGVPWLARLADRGAVRHEDEGRSAVM